MSSANELIDATKHSKLTNSNSLLTLTTPMSELKKLGNYKVMFEVERDGSATISLNSTIKIVDTIKINSLAYVVSTSKSAPSNFEKVTDHPNKITTLKDLQEGQYLHMQLTAHFEKTKGEHPEQVYVSLRKKASLFANVYANRYNKERGTYEITVDVANDLGEHLNGEYEIEVHVADARALQAEKWSVGSAQVWFKQGLDTGNNQGIKE